VCTQPTHAAVHRVYARCLLSPLDNRTTHISDRISGIPAFSEIPVDTPLCHAYSTSCPERSNAADSERQRTSSCRRWHRGRRSSREVDRRNRSREGKKWEVVSVGASRGRGLSGQLCSGPDPSPLPPASTVHRSSARMPRAGTTASRWATPRPLLPAPARAGRQCRQAARR
jgi:hypothetical protein